MTPIFLHVMNNGDLWVSSDVSFTPSGTVLGTYKITSLPSSKKIGTLTASAGAVTAAGSATGKFGKDIV